MVWNLPNLLSTLRILLAPVFIWFILSDSPLNIGISIVLFLIAAITDFFDGWIARKYEEITEWGAFFDPLADKVLTNSALIAFAMKEWIPIWMVLIIIVRDIGVTLLRIYAESIRQPIHTSKTAKWKTLLQMLFIIYVLLIYFLLTFTTYPFPFLQSLFHPQLLHSLFGLLTFFTIATAIEYGLKNKALLHSLWERHIKKIVRKSTILTAFLSACGIGYIPFAPGTVASTIFLFCYFLWLPKTTVFEFSLLLFLMALSVYGIFAIKTPLSDPSWIVIDEICGILTALLLFPDDASFSALLTLLILFRLFDILKPFPIRKIEKIPAVGIILDDLLAGIYAAAVMFMLSLTSIF